MTELQAYDRLIQGASTNLRDSVASVSNDIFSKRPITGANPISFIYFHVLRHWDRDINIYIQGQKPVEDAWHRHGLSEIFEYEPMGKGAGGIGTGYGYSSEEVDALPGNGDRLHRYHDILETETKELLTRLDPATFDDVQRHEDREFSIGQRLRHLVAHTYLHLGDIEYAKGLLGAPAGDFPTLA